MYFYVISFVNIKIFFCVKISRMECDGRGIKWWNLQLILASEVSTQVFITQHKICLRVLWNVWTAPYDQHICYLYFDNSWTEITSKDASKVLQLNINSEIDFEKGKVKFSMQSFMFNVLYFIFCIFGSLCWLFLLLEK